MTAHRQQWGLALVLLACSCLTLKADDEEISLQKALELFHARNYDILVSRYEVDKASADLAGARLIPNPGLSFNFTSIEFGRGQGIRLGDNSVWALRLDQLIELGGKRGLRTRTAEAALEAAGLAHKDVVRNLTAGFFALFYGVLLDELNADFSREELGRTDRILEISEKRFAAGALSLLDYSKLKLSRIEVETDLIEAEAQLGNDLEFFNVLLAEDRKLKPAKADASPFLPDYSEEGLVQEAWQKRPDLLALEKQLETAESARRLARAGAIPDLSLGAEYDSLGPTHQPAFGFGLSLNVPLFNRNQAEIRKSGYVRDQVKTQVDKVRRQVAADVREAWNNYSASRRVLETYQSHEHDMSDTLDRTGQAFARGGMTVLDFLDTQKTYRGFMARFRQALTQCRLNRALLELAVGGMS